MKHILKKYASYGLLLICHWFITLHSEPFSLQEIQSIPDFQLTKAQFLTASDGIQLAYYPFVNPTSKDIVLLYAGAGLYGNKTYQWVAKTLYEKYNVGCYIFDIRGHGHSQAVRGDAPSIDQVICDVSTATTYISQQHPDAKIHLAGHSSGAGLIINWASHAEYNHDLVRDYILIAPYLGPNSHALQQHANHDDSFVKSVRTWVYILGTIFPTSPCIHWNAVFFNYSAQLLQQDPLIVPEYTYTMSMATTPYEIDSLLPKIQKPTAIFIGTNDEQFIPQKIIDFAHLIKTPTHTQLIDGAKHMSILLSTPELIAQYIKKA